MDTGIAGDYGAVRPAVPYRNVSGRTAAERRANARARNRQVSGNTAIGPYNVRGVGNFVARVQRNLGGTVGGNQGVGIQPVLGDTGGDAAFEALAVAFLQIVVAALQAAGII